MKINIKKLNKNAVTPKHGSDYAAGYDLCACIDKMIMIPGHTTKKIGTGLAFELPENTFGGIFARSGLATKDGIRPSNCTGVIDCDYRGEVIVALHNDSSVPKTIRPNDRIGQLILIPYIPMEFEEVEELSETARGDGGFGSTGTH